ncbi:MAG: hypothetical protein M3P13_07385 [Acidobacteriota bacterium]|nr:hypothetical protein [Acidobacteriota bacterium]
MATAARRRRARETSRLLWRVAPIVSAIGLIVAAFVRWRNASAIVPPGLLAVSAAAWIAYAYLQRYRVRISDATASAIDDEARLGGELRSAAWFAARGTTDPWADFHLEQAANHLESIDFARLYLPARARRARVATGVMVALTVLLVATVPERPRAVAATRVAPSQTAPRKVPPVALDGVPAELPQGLEDLLAAIESGTFPSGTAADAALRNTLSQLQALKDPQALAALARAMAADRSRADDGAKMKELADRAKRDAAMTPPSDIRDALDQLSKKLSDPEREMDSAGFEKSDEAQPQGGVDLAGPPPQSARDASAVASLGVVALSKQEASDPNAPPGAGAGGASSSPGPGGTMAGISKALRHEIIEANEDDVSGDVHTAERRQTERGKAAATFTGSASGTFDATRASAPPPVPETRRAGIQTYFSRKQ